MCAHFHAILFCELDRLSHDVRIPGVKAAGHVATSNVSQDFLIQPSLSFVARFTLRCKSRKGPKNSHKTQSERFAQRMR